MLRVVKSLWKSVVFGVLNLLVIVWLSLILETLVRVLRGEDPLALLGILAADIAFLIAGILLVILSRYYRISLASRVLPFIAILILTTLAFLNVTALSLWAGIVVSGALILVCIAMTLRTLIVSGKSSQSGTIL